MVKDMHTNGAVWEPETWEEYGAFAYDHRRWIRRHNRDWLVLLVGDEGDGKTSGGLELGFWMQPDAEGDLLPFGLNIDDMQAQGNNVYWDLMDYIDVNDAINKRTRPKGETFVFDEAGTQCMNLSPHSAANKAITQMFVANRKANCCHLFCTPKPSILTKYLRQFRMRCIIYFYREYDEDTDTLPCYAAVYYRRKLARMLINSKWPEWWVDHHTLFNHLKPDNVLFVPPPDKYLNRDFIELYEEGDRRWKQGLYAHARAIVKAERMREAMEDYGAAEMVATAANVPQATPVVRAVPILSLLPILGKSESWLRTICRRGATNGVQAVKVGSARSWAVDYNSLPALYKLAGCEYNPDHWTEGRKAAGLEPIPPAEVEA